MTRGKGFVSYSEVASTKAYFGKPVGRYVKGGAHLGAEIILKQKERFLALRRPEGLYGGPKDALYFPHGEFLFGEEVRESVARIVRAQAGMKVSNHEVVDLWSWIAEEKGHWHLVAVLVADVRGKPHPPREISESVQFTLDRIPSDLAWWKEEEFIYVIKKSLWRYGEY